MSNAGLGWEYYLRGEKDLEAPGGGGDPTLAGVDLCISTSTQRDND
jgi:hypothetical protein